MTLISAHQLGAPKGAPDEAIPLALEAVLRIACDYVEVDLRRTRDGHLVVRHDVSVTTADGHVKVSRLTLAELQAAAPVSTTFEEVLDHLRGARKGLHLDLKFSSPLELYEAAPDACHEVAAVRRAVEVLGADGVVVTTGTDRAVAAIRTWSAASHPELMIGLSLGKSRAGLPWREQVEGRLGELFPGRRIDGCGAKLVVANHWLARFGVARLTARRGLSLLVWTVDSRRGLVRWLADPRVWMVTTNQAQLAVEVRRQLRSRRPS